MMQDVRESVLINRWKFVYTASVKRRSVKTTVDNFIRRILR